MVPESSLSAQDFALSLDPFPSRWVTIRSHRDIDASDASLVQFGGKWWILQRFEANWAVEMDSLSLFCANDLFGPWSPHPANPVWLMLREQAGWSVSPEEGRLWRPVQDCRAGYGRALD